MTLLQLRDKIDAIIENHPSWQDCARIGIVTETFEDGSKDIQWLEDFKSICCDGQGMVAFELVMED